MSIPAHRKLLAFAQLILHASCVICPCPCQLPIVTHLEASSPTSSDPNCLSSSSLLVSLSLHFSPLLLIHTLFMQCTSSPQLHRSLPPLWFSLPAAKTSAAASTESFLQIYHLSFHTYNILFHLICCLFHCKLFSLGEKTEYKFLVSLYIGLVC